MQVLFMSLLAASEVEKGLLRVISNYFAIIKTNRREMLHLHCFVWLKKTLHLTSLRSQI